MDLSFKTNNLSIGYPDISILENIDISILKGDICCLLGSNGSGKSTFIKTITKIIKPKKGNFNLGENITISTVPQFKKIQFHYPLKVNDVIFLENKFSFFKKKISSENEIILSKLGIFEIENLLLKECSGGQLQKVLIARSLISKSNLIFLDEPLDALDKQTKLNMTELLIDEAKNKNKTFFIITHNIEKEWLKNFNRVFQVIENGIKEI